MSSSNDRRTNVYSLSISLTESRIARLSNANGSSDLFARDPGLKGFGLKISKNNCKSFFVEAREGSTGKPRRIVIGQHPFMTLQKARETALEALRTLKYGSGSAEARSAGTPLQGLTEAFLSDKESTLRPRTIEDYRMVVRSGCFAQWMTKDVRGITRKDVMEHYRLLCEERGVGMANKSMRILSSMLNYGRAIYPALENWSNPVRVLAETRARVQLKPRTRFIRLDQLKVWQGALDKYVDDARMPIETIRRKDIRLLPLILLMTGLRSNEARSMKWSDLDLSEGTITIPSNVAKNHMEAILPVNSWLLSELQSRQAMATGRYLFESQEAQGYIRNLRRPITQISSISGVPFTPHDLRRTFATYLDGIGAPFSVIKQLLNHKPSSDVTERYIQRRSVEDLRPYVEQVLIVIQEHFRTPSIRESKEV